MPLIKGRISICAAAHLKQDPEKERGDVVGGALLPMRLCVCGGVWFLKSGISKTSKSNVLIRALMSVT